MSEKTTTTEINEEKLSDKICQTLDISDNINVEFNEEIIEMIKKCGKRDQKAILNTYNKLISNHIERFATLKSVFTEIEVNEKAMIEQAKLMKSMRKKKSSTKDDETDSNDGENTKIAAVKKPALCHPFVKKFMNEERDEYSPSEIRSKMNDFVKKERESNSDKINVKAETEGGDVNKKIFNVYGELKDFIKECSNIASEDVSFIEKTIKEKKKSKPEKGTSAFNEIEYMSEWAKEKKKLIEAPATLQFTDFMKYSPFCFIERNTLDKSKKKTASSKVESTDSKKTD